MGQKVAVGETLAEGAAAEEVDAVGADAAAWPECPSHE